MTMPLTPAPQVRHRLAAALRFDDAFTSLPIGVPLDVGAETLPVVQNMPLLPWRAVRAADGTYRLLVSQNTAMPAGAVGLTVTAPGGEYEDYETFTLTLPLPLAGPYPTRADYLVRRRLFPTRRLRLQPGETGVLGLVVDGSAAPVAGLRMRIAEAPAPIAPGVPYTYTAADGSFLVRLPGLRAMTGSPPVATPRTTASVVLEVVRPPATPVVPTAPAFPLALALGRTTTLLITVP